jgi:hypothetical protein
MVESAATMRMSAPGEVHEKKPFQRGPSLRSSCGGTGIVARPRYADRPFHVHIAPQRQPSRNCREVPPSHLPPKTTLPHLDQPATATVAFAAAANTRGFTRVLVRLRRPASPGLHRWETCADQRGQGDLSAREMSLPSGSDVLT